MGLLPVGFVSHGAPLSLEDTEWRESLGLWGKSIGQVKAILVLSAHWVTSHPMIGPLDPVPLIYDFWGFPERFYQLTYPSPVSPELGRRLASMPGLEDLRPIPSRGLDHGMWVPLAGLFPEGEIPVLGLSLPGFSPEKLYALGKSLAPLREEGILFLASGGMTHNLGELDPNLHAPPRPWALSFDQWVAEALSKSDISSLLDFETRAPHPRKSHPTLEHFAPLFVALGSAEGYSRVTFPVTGFRWGSLSLRSVQFDG
jgi:4,5-DOPA dioxygenase extradiol